MGCLLLGLGDRVTSWRHLPLGQPLKSPTTPSWILGLVLDPGRTEDSEFIIQLQIYLALQKQNTRTLKSQVHRYSELNGSKEMKDGDTASATRMLLLEKKSRTQKSGMSDLTVLPLTGIDERQLEESASNLVTQYPRLQVKSQTCSRTKIQRSKPTVRKWVSRPKIDHQMR